MPAGKGKGKSSRGSIGRNRSRSRNTTPASVFDFPSEYGDSAAAATAVLGYNEIIDKYITNIGGPSDSGGNGNGSSLGTNAIPTSSQLQQLTQELKSIIVAAKSRSQASDHMSLRMTTRLVKRREEEKEKAEKDAREKSIQDRDERERRRQRSDSTDRRSEKLKDRDKDRKRRDSSVSRPHALGAHQPTSQAPSNVVVKEESAEGRTNMKKRKASGSDGGEESDYSQAGSAKKEEEDEVSDDGQPPPQPPIIVYQELDDDPSVYEIGAVTSETTVEEKKKIYSVAMFPQKDITHLLPGDPPDEDFSRAKPTNQVAMNTFTAYIEPYFRPYTEEDMAFLRERGDRVTPYVIPELGRLYQEVWGEEDGNATMSGLSLAENAPRGNPDEITDTVLENSTVSLGPLLSRVMAGLVSEDTEEQQSQEQQPVANGGDVTMGNAGGTSGAAEPSQTTQDSSQQQGTQSSSASNAKDQSTASNITLPEGHIPPKDWKVQANRPDYATVEERIRQELVYMGLVAPSDTFHFQDRQDDEVSARLRQLQAELRIVSIRNGARKARLMELLKEQLAYQEYFTILDDLDKQVDQAYLKRTRGMKAKKKRAGPNGHVNAGAARPGIGDVAKTVMERRGKWSDTIGPVFDKTVTLIPKDTIFDPAVMAVLEAKEAAGDAELDDE